ncbi:MAG: hypothetical protein DRP47_10755 [Candidatus Zixiibacteriota bacterium]|nr:MAG: hypothetical protein DRP47_10755 [candidate division Zixibacteria bacterium]
MVEEKRGLLVAQEKGCFPEGGYQGKGFEGNLWRLLMQPPLFYQHKELFSKVPFLRRVTFSASSHAPFFFSADIDNN